MPAAADRSLPPGFDVVWTTVAVDLVGFGMGLPVLARYAEDLGATPAQAGLVVAAFSAAQCACAPLLGRISDRVGRKPVLLASLVGTALGSLLTGLASSLWLLVAARLLDGASGASVSVAQATVIDVAPPDQRARLLGYLGGAFGVGLTAGPALGALAALASPRLPFYLAAALAAANALVALRRLPETHPGLQGTGRPSVDGATTPEALPSRSSLATRLALVGFLATAAFAGFEATYSLLLEDRHGASSSRTYLVFAAVGIALVAVQATLVGRSVQRLGALGATQVALVAVTGGLVLLTPEPWVFQLPALALLVAGQGILVPALATAVAEASPRARTATALGRQQSASALARTVGPALGGAVYGVNARFLPLAGAAVVVVALGALRLRRSDPAAAASLATGGVPGR